MKILIIFAVIMISSTQLSFARSLCPDGSWVGGEPNLAPDGSWVGDNDW